MKTVTVHIYTGKTRLNADLSKLLAPSLLGFAVEFTKKAKKADIVVTIPEYLKLFPNTPLLALSDNRDVFDDFENVIDYTPFPISDDDFLRLEFRIIGAAADVRLS